MINFIRFVGIAFLLQVITPSTSHAQEDAWTYTETDEHPGEQEHLTPQERAEDLNPSPELAMLDPLEDVNRYIFEFNEFLDFIILNPVGLVYSTLLPESLRVHIGYALRNLSEPIVFVNNMLQGDIQAAHVTLGRFITNSTLGLGGLFDVSDELGLPYKREDFGLTLASWGVPQGPYMVLPILGPSTVCDSFGRIGDYAFDPINWWAYFCDKAYYSYGRTGLQILDAKTDSYDMMEDLRKNSLDHYATLRAWYLERRKALANIEHDPIETATPDDEE